MSDTFYGDPQGSNDDFQAAVDAAPVSPVAAIGTGMVDAASDLSLRAGHLAQQLGRSPNVLSPDDANERYGVDGYLRFNKPTDEGDAAFRGFMAQRQAEKDTLDSRANVNPLVSMGANLLGGMADPVGLPVMIAGGALAKAGLGVLGVGAEGAVDATEAVTRAGRLANMATDFAGVAGEGALANVPYLGADYALRSSEGEDITGGEALRDLAMGATFHTLGHYGGMALGKVLDRAASASDPAIVTSEAEPEEPGAPPPPIPPEVMQLPESARQAAFLKAVDDMADDRPVDIQRYIDRERAATGDVSGLDEATAQPSIAFRDVGGDTAVTPRGDDVGVRYGLAELNDLSTSHGDNLEPNPAYPQALQPRDRTRAGSQAQNYRMEAELNPKLLMRDVSAAGGAPIVAPDGTVESGNGRTIALRRSYATGSPAYGRYRAELEAQGYDTTDMAAPVLVRMRSDAMSGAGRVELARRMNADTSERLGPAEQAMSDARRVDPALDADDAEGASPLSSRDFTRAFIAHVAPDQANTFVDAKGRLSPEGGRRIRGALLARAYGDARLVAQVYEGEDSPTRKLGEALADAAPAWAKMRAAAAVGDIPRPLDITDALTSALDLVRGAKAAGDDVASVLEQLRGQKDLFGEEAVSPATEALLRLMFRDARLRQPRAAEKITRALRDYAGQAMEVTPGPDLFGGEADESTARNILALVADRYARGDAGPVDIVRPPGPTTGEEQGARPPLIDLSEPGGDRGGRSGGLRPESGGRPGGEGDGPELRAEAADAGEDPGEPAAAERPAANPLAADPELKALADDVDAFAKANALTPPEETPAQKPATIATAIQAAAQCLLDAADEVFG